jgi:hypothetical protein
MIDVGVSPARIRCGEPAELAVTLTNTGTRICRRVIFVIRLPVGIVRLRGQERIELSELMPGEPRTSSLRIQAEEPGRYKLTSTNFSYRDQHDRPYRDTSFAAEILVDAQQDRPAGPRVTAGLQADVLPYDEWTVLRSRITNTGTVSVSDLEITLSGQVITDRRTSRSTLEQLPPGRSADVPFYVRVRAPGANVPVHLDVSYSDQSGRHAMQTTHSLRVVREATTGTREAQGPAQPVVKILFLGASPRQTDWLRLDKEIREIQRAIQSGKERDNIKMTIRLAVRAEDISQALLDDEPRLVHFAGHGGGLDESFAAEDEYGSEHIIPVVGLVQLFQFAGRHVECVIVNACQTEALARALSAQVPYVIGMRQSVGDGSAIRFSTGFYQAVAAGRPIEDAFGLGQAQLMMVHSGADPRAPILFRRDAR